MPAAQDGPPCAGSLRVLVHRAYGLRRDVNGGLPDPQIRLRILTNPKVGCDLPLLCSPPILSLPVHFVPCLQCASREILQPRKLNSDINRG